jgi:hypothetical protein
MSCPMSIFPLALTKSKSNFGPHHATMILGWLLVTCLAHGVLTQPLEMDQYTALMSVYDGLGSLFC